MAQYTHADIDVHINAARPHASHEQVERKDEADGYPSLDGSALIPTDELATGTADADAFLRGDRTWQPIDTTDEKTKVSANDSTPGYLSGKLVAGRNVVFTENNDGNDETLTVEAVAPTAGTGINSVGTD